jgi:glyoxylase-like metal-dependent hydrolase (beta-lactamase superfamily II)
MNKPLAPFWYHRERIRDDLYLITEPHYTWENRANLWLILGRDANLLIDAGLGVSSLKLHLADVLDRPLKVVATHVHFDHCGCCHEFDEVFIHEAEHQALREGDQGLMLADPAFNYTPAGDFHRLPYEGFSASDYRVRACPQAQKLQHGSVIDLGNKTFEVMHLPGHSSGSIGLLDNNGKQFFSGDVVYDGELLDQLEDSVIGHYEDSMKALLNLNPDEIRPGHYQSFDAHKMHALVRDYLQQHKAPRCPSETA